MIISLLNQKGGCGKTTLSIHLGAYQAMQSYRVLLVDADPQGSALAWAAAREGPPLLPVIGLPVKTLHREIQPHLENYDLVVIDGAPRVNELARSAIIASDLVLIPVNPSPYDVWAAKEIVDLLTEARVYKDALKAAFVINRRIVNTAIGRDVVEALSGYPFPVLGPTIGQRVAFAESAATGQVVMELDPTSQASREIEALAREVMIYAGENGVIRHNAQSQPAAPIA